MQIAGRIRVENPARPSTLPKFEEDSMQPCGVSWALLAADLETAGTALNIGCKHKFASICFCKY